MLISLLMIMNFHSWRVSNSGASIKCYFHKVRLIALMCLFLMRLNLMTIAVAKWDEEFSASEKMGSKREGTSIGYVADEW